MTDAFFEVRPPQGSQPASGVQALKAIPPGTGAPDPQCHGLPWVDAEWPGGGCLGYQLALAVPLLLLTRRRLRPLWSIR